MGVPKGLPEFIQQEWNKTEEETPSSEETDRVEADPGQGGEDAGGTDAAEPSGDRQSPEGEDKGAEGSRTDAESGQRDPETGGEAGQPAEGTEPQTVRATIKHRGQTINLELTPEEHIKFLQKGYDYETLMAERKESIETETVKRLDDWAEKVGLSSRGEDGTLVPTVEGAVGLALAIAKQQHGDKAMEILRAAIGTKVPEVEEKEDDLALIEKDLDPDDETHRIALTLVQSLRKVREENAGLREELNQKVTPLTERFKTEEERANESQRTEVAVRLATHHKSEIAKYPILLKGNERSQAADRSQMVARANELLREGKAKTREEALSQATRDFAEDRRTMFSATEEEKKRAEKDSRPQPGKPVPSIRSGGGVVPDAGEKNGAASDRRKQGRVGKVAAFLREAGWKPNT